MQCVWLSPVPGERDGRDRSMWMCWDPALEWGQERLCRRADPTCQTQKPRRAWSRRTQRTTCAQDEEGQTQGRARNKIFLTEDICQAAIITSAGKWNRTETSLQALQPPQGKHLISSSGWQEGYPICALCT